MTEYTEKSTEPSGCIVLAHDLLELYLGHGLHIFPSRQ